MSPLLLRRTRLCRVTRSLLPLDIANGWAARVTEFGCPAWWHLVWSPLGSTTSHVFSPSRVR
jgi:hypothetical protein